MFPNQGKITCVECGLEIDPDCNEFYCVESHKEPYPTMCGIIFGLCSDCITVLSMEDKLARIFDSEEPSYFKLMYHGKFFLNVSR